MPMTNPPSPLVVGGQEYPNWTTDGDAFVLLDVPADATSTFIHELGRHVPGKLEDGTDVLWMILSAGTPPGADEGSRVTVYPEVAIQAPKTRLTISFGVEEGHVFSREAAKGLVGQWFTIMFGGAAVLAQVVEAEAMEDGTRVQLTAETDWTGVQPNPDYESEV